MSSTVENIMSAAIQEGSRTTFTTFDDLLKAAIDDGLLPQPVSYQATSARINFQFNEWMKANRQAVTDDAGAIVNYQQHLTAANFMAYLSEQAEQVAEVKKDRAARWKAKPQQAPACWPDLFVVDNWEAHLDILCNTEPPLLVKDGEQYRPAKGVPRGSIAAAFNTFKTYLGHNRLKVDHRELVAKALEKLLPNFQVSGNTVTNKSDHYTKRRHGQEKSLEKQIEAALCRF